MDPFFRLTRLRWMDVLYRPCSYTRSLATGRRNVSPFRHTNTDEVKIRTGRAGQRQSAEISPCVCTARWDDNDAGRTSRPGGEEEGLDECEAFRGSVCHHGGE